MKKHFSFLLAVMLLFLCSCSKKEPEKPKTADMLTITNEESTFLGCKSRLDSVVAAMTAKISVLEGAHNSVIEAENETEYFLDDNYILTSFEPFLLDTISVTDGFTSEMTNESAQDYYNAISEGMDITFSSDGESYELVLVSESVIKSYQAEYDKKNDSLRYVHTLEVSGNESVEEFIEFIKVDKNAYAIQSNERRCYIEFNEDGEIVYFCCGKLSAEEFATDETIYPESEKKTDGFWVTERGKTKYSGIHTFENNVLIHEDCSSGPWKTIRINADDYASAFLR